MALPFIALRLKDYPLGNAKLYETRNILNLSRQATAYGAIELNQEADIFIPQLGLWIIAYVLPDGADILSLGRLVEREGCDYTWRQGEIPTLWANGRGIALHPKHDVPYLTFSIAVVTKNADGEEVHIPDSQEDFGVKLTFSRNRAFHLSSGFCP